MRAPFKYLAVIAVVAGAAASGCRMVPVESVPSLEEEAYTAARIARVRIGQVEQIRAGIDKDAPICGYRYSVKVIEGFKGGETPFFLFAVVHGLTQGRDYLVFAHEAPHDPSNIMVGLEDVQLPLEQRLLSCRIRAAKYVLPANRQTYFGFDVDTPKRPGDEWLAPVDPKDNLGFSWCLSDGPPNIRPVKRNIFLFRDIGQGEEKKREVKWQDANQLIREALKNSPYWLGIIPNPLFGPRTC